MQLDNPYILALLAAAVLSAAIAYSAGRRGRSPGARPLVFLALAAALWQVGYAFELGAVEESTKLLWAKLESPGIAGVPVAWFALAVEYNLRGGAEVLAPSTYAGFTAFVRAPTAVLVPDTDSYYNAPRNMLWRRR